MTSSKEHMVQQEKRRKAMKKLLKTCFKKVTVHLLTAAMLLSTVVTAAPVSASAAGTAEVSASVSNGISIDSMVYMAFLQQVNNWNKTAPWDYSGANGCAASSRYMFKTFYGHTDGTSNAGNRKDRFCSTNGVAYTSSRTMLNDLKKYAAPGDAFRITYGKKTHIMDLIDITSAGKIMLMESNYAGGSHNKARITTYGSSGSVVKAITGLTTDSSGAFKTSANKTASVTLFIIHSNKNPLSYKDLSCNGGAGSGSQFIRVSNKVSFSNYSVGSITTNNAIPKCRITYTGARPNQVAIYIGTSTSNMKKAASDTINHSKNPFDTWYNLKTEGKMTLKSKTTYYYQFYVYYSGNSTPVKSAVKSFKTK